MICTSSTSGEHWFFDIAGNRVKCEFCQVIMERRTNLNSDLCANCGHSWDQHHKGPVTQDYYRHCPCQSYQTKGNYILNPLDILEGVIYTISTG